MDIYVTEYGTALTTILPILFLYLNTVTVTAEPLNRNESRRFGALKSDGHKTWKCADSELVRQLRCFLYMYSSLTSHGYSKSIKTVRRQRNLGLIVGDSNLCDFWEYGRSDLPLVYVIWKYIHLGVFTFVFYNDTKPSYH